MKMRALNLGKGVSRVSSTHLVVDDVVLAQYRTTHSFGLEWQARPQSINFSLTFNEGGLALNGTARSPYSLLMYVEPDASSWSGVLEASQGSHPDVYLSLPLSFFDRLELPRVLLRRGFNEVAVGVKQAMAFHYCTQKVLEDGVERRQYEFDELCVILRGMLSPLIEAEVSQRSLSDYSQLIARVNNHLEMRGETRTSVVELARGLDVSVRALQRAYQTVYGKGVSECLRSRRLERAHQLLTQGKDTVARVASATGFHHVGRFAYYYRSHFGMSPSETRQQR
jgi:AraC-like DNA-binding protein